MNTKIRTIKARQILDCKVRPVLEVDVITEDGIMGRSMAPTGTSVGSHESFILRDHDPGRFEGMGVEKAVKVVEDIIAPILIGMDVCDQEEIDKRMIALDGTPDKSHLGGNCTYSVSGACLRAAAASYKLPTHRYLAKDNLKRVPVLSFNIVNGGRNDNGITQGFNEFMIVPYKAESMNEIAEIGVAVMKRLGIIIERYQGGKRAQLGESYGWAAPSSEPEVVMGLIAEAVEDCGYTDKMAYCLDVASNEMYNPNDHTYELADCRVSNDEMIAKAKYLTEKYPILFIEDLLSEDDWDGFVKAHRILTRTNVIGDDFIATNIQRLQKAKEMDAIDGFILKPNQVGTITEALAACEYAKSNGLFFVPSGRAGGAVGDIVEEISVGWQALLAKNGVPKSGERLNSLNNYLRASNENRQLPLADLSSLIRF